jgi:hypothetical protein
MAHSIPVAVQGQPIEEHGFFHGLFVARFRALLPFRAAAFLALLATSFHFIPWFADYPVAVTLGLLALAGIGVVGIQLMNVVHSENKIFGFIVIGTCTAWLLLVYYADPGFVFCAITLLVMTAGFGMFYALDRRNLTTISIQEKTRSWAQNVEAQKNVDLKGTRWESYDKTEFGWTGVLAWDGANNMVEKIVENRRKLETQWHEKLDTVSIEPVVDHATGQTESNKVRVRCVQTNPLRQMILWDGVYAESVTTWRPCAMYADAQVAKDRIWTPGIGGRHKLFAGASRSGKSVGMKQEIVTYGPLGKIDGSVAITLCDLKGGTSFMKYASMSAWTVTTPEDAVLQLEVLAAITVARGAYVASRKDWGEVWEPGPGFPIILAYFDEISVLLDKDADSGMRRRAINAMKTVARMGMGLGVLMRLGVQEPTAEAVGSMQILAQLVYRVGFRLQYMDRAKYCIPNLASKGVEPGNIPIDHNGECYIEDGILNRTVKARWVNVTPQQETRTIKDCATGVPEFAYCDYSDSMLDVDGTQVPLRDVLGARRRYSIEEAPPAETDEIEVEGYILRLPEERRAELAAAARAQERQDHQIAPARQPRALTDGSADASAAPAARVRPTQAASPQVSASDEMALRRALRGTQMPLRRSIATALIEAGRDGLSVKAMQQVCEADGHPQPSRGYVNKLLREWRGLDPEHPCSPPVVGDGGPGSWVWLAGAEPEPEDAPAAHLSIDTDGDGIDDDVEVPAPPHPGWTPRVITNDEEEDDDE